MKSRNKIMIMIAIGILLAVIITCIVLLIIRGNGVKKEQVNNETAKKEDVVKVYEEEKKEVKEPEIKKDTKVDIIDINSESRPYMVVVNNTPIAVQVQEGLNRAYIVYEIPTEGYTSRLLALFKDIPDDIEIGTIRSARHNFIDYALENDAIFCCWGWSFIAERDLRGGITDYMQGLWGYPFYRDNKEGLALEHTAYTSMWKLVDKAQQEGFRTTTLNKTLLNYDTDDIDLSSVSNVKVANNVVIPYGNAPDITSFKYDSNTKMYTRFENGNECTDYGTKEHVVTKNIIVQKVNYTNAEGDYYLDIKTVGTGEGYYITNGFAVPIIWTKDDRGSKTRYTYAQNVKIDGNDVSGKEIVVSDGRTYIELQTNEQPLTIE